MDGGVSRGESRILPTAARFSNLLTLRVPLEDVQNLANHADPRTTRLYDRRQRKVTRNIVERIPVCAESLEPEPTAADG